MILLIVADDYRMAEYWAHERGLRPWEWTYVTSPIDVYGRRDGRYVLLTEGARARVDWTRRGEILEALRMQGFTLEGS